MFNKKTLITAFALFSLFFGAGNLILPPYLGWQAADNWPLVAIGFVITAVLIPILGILAHAKLQGNMYDFAKGGGHWFAIVYCFIVYAISISLPAPRTASVTYEMAVASWLDIPSWGSSLVYFTLVFVLVLNRTKVIDFIGKFLSPLIGIILLLIIGLAIFGEPHTLAKSSMETPLVSGLLEGYQTFDAIGSIVVGGVIIISLGFGPKRSYIEKKKHIALAGILAGFGLLIIYVGLQYTGAYHHHLFPEKAIRTKVLQTISFHSLGNIGHSFLSILVALACFTTAVGIITGTADYFKEYFSQFRYSYQATALIACILGLLIGQFDVHYIIDIALPVLMFIYPVSIGLILLNLCPEKWQNPITYKTVLIVIFICSIPDFLHFIISEENIQPWQNPLPLASYNMGWILPAILSFLIVTSIQYLRLMPKS